MPYFKTYINMLARRRELLKLRILEPLLLWMQ